MMTKEEFKDACYWEATYKYVDGRSQLVANGEGNFDAFEYLFGFTDEGSDYEASAYAVLRKDGQLFEYEDSHCSCNGFTFNPAPVTLEYLKTRPAPYSRDSLRTEEQTAFTAFVAGLK